VRRRVERHLLLALAVPHVRREAAAGTPQRSRGVDTQRLPPNASTPSSRTVIDFPLLNDRVLDGIIDRTRH
jgi:hypothetical protein